MEVRKVLKRVLAIGAGATMVGATLLSAMAAADLANYPAPFVQNGTFNAFIVVGDKAAAEDVVGAVDIGASLQFQMKQETTVSTSGASEITLSNGVKIKGTGTRILHYNDSLGGVRQTALDSNDLPVMLADGRYVESQGATTNDQTYTQQIVLNDSTSNDQVLHDQPDTGYDMNDYLELKSYGPVYRYKLQFDTDISYDTSGTSVTKGSCQDDLTGSQIEIQGNTYTITNVKMYATPGVAGCTSGIQEMTVMAGDTLVWLVQQQVITKTIGGVSHEIKVVDVTEAGDSCGVSVDGNVAWVDKNSNKVINGVKIGVLDVKPVHSQLQDTNVCELNIGASELKLRDGQNLLRDGVEVKYAKSYLNPTTTAGNGTTDNNNGQWGGFTVEYTPQNNVYLANGTSFTDPALGNFKFVMGGVTTPREEIATTASSRRGDITFTNNDGKQVDVPFQIDTNSATTGLLNVVSFGKDSRRPLLFNGETWFCGNSNPTLANANSCNGVELYAITSGQTAHIIEISSVDATGGTVSLNDLTYGRSWSDKAYTNGLIDLGSLGKIGLNFNGTNNGTLIVSGLDANTQNPGEVAQTYNGALLHLNNATGSNITSTLGAYTALFNLTEQAGSNADVASRNIKTDVKYDNVTNDRLEVQFNTTGTAYVQPYGTTNKFDGNSDVSVWSTAYGTLIEGDTSSTAHYVNIWYPKNEVEVQTFIAPVSAQITSTGGALTTVTLNKINVGAARLASEISDPTADNLIIVGGPCANDVAAKVMGQSGANCASGFQEGQAIVKLYDTGAGKVAMVVAGMTAMDTRRATRVVANFDAYANTFKGTEVVVTGTSLSDIKVQAPS